VLLLRADHKRFLEEAAAYRNTTATTGVLRGDCVDDYRICDIVDSSTEGSPFNGMDIAGGDYPNYLWSCQTPGEEAKDLRDQVKSSTGVQLPDEITKISLVGLKLGEEIIFKFKSDSQATKMLIGKSIRRLEKGTKVQIPEDFGLGNDLQALQFLRSSRLPG